MRIIFFISVQLFLSCANAQQPDSYTEWSNDAGNGFYNNPVLHSDYSDPDAIRVGDDYYMISSSFNHVPGLPILHSKDLVNWKLIGHALKRLSPEDHFSSVRHGGGVWAPSIRFHKNEFYIFFPDPDFGIYLTKSKNILGPWSEPILVAAGKGLIDPCPLWDDNGKAYLVHAFAGSRAGIKSIIVVKEMNVQGTKISDQGVIVFDGHDTDPTVEGPKFYKRNGYYYIFAPAGGVSTGWQLALRSKNVFGPYERKVVMHQGNTEVNGPHQGAWVDTKSGENWFLHFQDKDAYGRIVHLQPMKWVKDWPIIGNDIDGDGTGEPVLKHRKPAISAASGKNEISSSVDEFNSIRNGLQWQWQANPGTNWSFANSGFLRMYAQHVPDSNYSLWNYPGMLLQKFPSEQFVATVKLRPKFLSGTERFGLIIFGTDYAFVNVTGDKSNTFMNIDFSISKNAEKREEKWMDAPVRIKPSEYIYLRVIVGKSGQSQFGYSTDGKDFIMKEQKFIAKPGKWVGAKVGLFATSGTKTNDTGYAEVDWFKMEKVE